MYDLSIQQINSQIMFGSFTNEQLNSIVSAIKYRRGQIVKENKRSIIMGDVVRFVNPRSGRTHQGNVVKINIKNVKVREGYTTWTVPANMLTVAE
jgi:hypothetical protein